MATRWHPEVLSGLEPHALLAVVTRMAWRVEPLLAWEPEAAALLWPVETAIGLAHFFAGGPVDDPGASGDALAAAVNLADGLGGTARAETEQDPLGHRFWHGDGSPQDMLSVGRVSREAARPPAIAAPAVTSPGAGACARSALLAALWTFEFDVRKRHLLLRGRAGQDSEVAGWLLLSAARQLLHWASTAVSEVGMTAERSPIKADPERIVSLVRLDSEALPQRLRRFPTVAIQGAPREMVESFCEAVQHYYEPDLERTERVDPSASGPMGPLWPKEVPEWFEEGCRRLRDLQVERGAVPAPPEPEVPIAPRRDEPFRASREVARLALECRAEESPSLPGLNVTSRRFAPGDVPPSKDLDLVGEAIGERLLGSLANEVHAAAVREPEAGRFLVMTGWHFSEPVVEELVYLLGLSYQAPRLSAFLEGLGGEFRNWLERIPEAQLQLRAVMEDDRLFLRYPPRRMAPRHSKERK